jgi:Spy/CpxP family protein refolding chaperone
MSQTENAAVSSNNQEHVPTEEIPMFRRSHVLSLIVLVAGLLAGGALAFAQGPPDGGPRGRGPGFGPGGPGAGLSLRALNLTDAQQEQVRQLTQQNREQMRALMDRMRTAQDARRKAVEAVPFNESQVRAAMKDVADVEADLAVAQARLQADVYALLTGDQQQQLQKLRADREARAKERAQQQQQRLQQRQQQRQARPQA